MNTMQVRGYQDRIDRMLTGLPVYVVLVDPIAYELTRLHCELGGKLVGLKDGLVYCYFEGSPPQFEYLWEGIEWHIVVEVK